MPLPFSDFPAYRARLAGVSGADVHHGQASAFGLVGDKVLKLPECPAVQARPDSFPGRDAGADVGQVFHTDFTRTGEDCFGNDGLAHFVVDVLHTPLFTTGDSPELAFGSPATVGLETATISKVNVAVVPEFPAAPDLAGAGCSEVVFANVDAEYTSTSSRWGIGKIDNEIEVPDALALDQARFLRDAAGEQVALVLAAGKGDALTSCEREQRDGIAFQRVGALVERRGRRIEADFWNRLVFGDALIGLERFVGVGHAVNGLAHHLAAKLWKLLAYRIVGQVVERYTVPASVRHRQRNDGVAGASKRLCQSRQRRRLSGGRQQFQGYGALAHTGNFTLCFVNMPTTGGALSSPA